MRDGKTIRSLAAGLAMLFASERLRDGDKEGADAFCDLAEAIKKIPLKDG